jgi:hypothetical protein
MGLLLVRVCFSPRGFLDSAVFDFSLISRIEIPSLDHNGFSATCLLPSSV